MRVANESLSWELLDYWRASGLPIFTVECYPIVVARTVRGKITGMAAVNSTEVTTMLVEPLLASSLHVGLSVMDEMERLLRQMGVGEYSVRLDPAYGPEGWIDQVRKSGAFDEVGVLADGDVLFKRDLVTRRVA